MREFIKQNQDTILNLLRQNAKALENQGKKFGNGQCAKFIRMALEGINFESGIKIPGWKIDVENKTSAKQYGDNLCKIGYNFLLTTSPTEKDKARNRFLVKGEVLTYGKQEYSPHKLDIAVFDDKVGHGHIAMFDGQDWYSDFKQKDCAGGRAYRDPNISVCFYRILK